MTNNQPDLIDPSDTSDDPRRHLRLLPSNGRFDAIGLKGKPSIDVFDLNGDVRGRKLPEGRKNTLLKLQLLILDYQEQHRLGNDRVMLEIKQAILAEPFPSVLQFLVDLARSPGADLVLRPGVRDTIEFFSIESW